MSKRARDRVALESIEKMRHEGLSRAIWDIRETRLDYPLIGSHQVVLNLEALGLTSADSVAVIYLHDRTQHEHSKLVAQNRGIPNIGYFDSLEAGIDWLNNRS